MDGKIALEEHATTEANNALWDSGGEDDRNGRAYAQSVAARLLDLDGHLREMDRSGVEFTILSLTAPGVQSVADPSRAVDLARSTNDELAGRVRRHADRLSAFAAVPMQDPEAAGLELARAVGEHGFKGALINGYSTIGGEEDVKYLDEGADVFWAKAAELDVPVYLHPREPLPSQRRAMQGYPELVGSAWGFGYETATHSVRLMLSGLFDRFPTLRSSSGIMARGCRSYCHAYNIGSTRSGKASVAPRPCIAQLLLRKKLLADDQRSLPCAPAEVGHRGDRLGAGAVLDRLPFRGDGAGGALVRRPSHGSGSEVLHRPRQRRGSIPI